MIVGEYKLFGEKKMKYILTLIIVVFVSVESYADMSNCSTGYGKSFKHSYSIFRFSDAFISIKSNHHHPENPDDLDMLIPIGGVIFVPQNRHGNERLHYQLISMGADTAVIKYTSISYSRATKKGNKCIGEFTVNYQTE